MQRHLIAPLLFVTACGIDGADPSADPATDTVPSVIKTGWIPTPQGEFMHVTYEERADGTRVFQGDIRLGRVWDEVPDEKTRGAIRYGGRWGNNRVPYRIAPSIPNQQRIHEAIAVWNTQTPYYLVPHNGESNYVVFDRHGTDCASPVGMQGGEQEIQVADVCGTSAIIHEIGHTIGMWHEQSRQDRDHHVDIHLDNVPEDRRHNFDKYAWGDAYDWGVYDHESIMHYGSSYFAIDPNRPTITRKDGSLITPSTTLTGFDRAAAWNSGASGDPLRLKWLAFGAQLGWPTDRPDYNGNYRFLPTQNGRVYAASANGPYLEVHGDIARKYGEVGWATGFLGLPLTDESAVIDGRGRYNHFQNGSIYWTLQTGAHTIYGAIRDKWRELGGEGGFLGYPTTDESAGAHSGGRYNHFEHGSIYYSPATWVHTIYGDIRNKWFSMGAENSYLGYPTTDELWDYPHVARFNHFQGGAIYYVPGSGTFAMPRTVRDRWAQIGWEQSCLRYPNSDFTDWGGGDGVQNFTGGSVWVSSYSGVWVFCNDRGWL